MNRMNFRRFAMMMVAAMLATGAFAKRTSPDVGGKIVDENGNPMSFVSVVLLSMPDSVFIQGSVSDDNGEFKLITPENQGILKISSVGYETLYVAVSSDGNIAGGSVIKMKEDNTMLNEVVVKGQLPKTKLQGSSMVTQIQGSVLEKSGTLDEMLSKVPGLMKGKEGIEVIGKGSPLIYINGRKLQDQDELKRLSSQEIVSVEVDMNPGARYDATVTSVVRIRTIKHQGEGFGFTAMVSNNQQLRYGQSDPNANFKANYRYRSWDFFGQVNFWERHNTNESYASQQSYYKDKNALVQLEQDNWFRSDWHGYGLNYIFGTNWQISNNHSVGFRVQYNDKLYDRNHADIRTDYYRNGVFEDHIDGKESEKGTQPYSWQGNTYYNGQVGKLNIDLNVDFYSDKSETSDKSDETYGTGRVNHISSTSTTSDRMVAEKLVLTYPLWIGMLGVGNEMSFVNRNSSYFITGTAIPATNSKTNEQNIAAFIDYGFSLGKIGQGSIGLRYEHVGFDYRDRLNAESNLKRYTDDLFPSIAFSRMFGNVQTSLSYSKKTVRPRYWQLSSAITYANAFTIQSGDPTLENQKNHELNLNVRWKWVTFSSSWQRMEKQLTQWSFLYNDDGVIMIKHINLDKPINRYSAFVNASPTFGVWSPSLTMGIIGFDTKLDLADPREATGTRQVCYKKPLGIMQFNNTIRLKHSWQFEFGCDYQTRGDYVNMHVNYTSCDVSATVQKCWLKNDALCLRVSVYNLLQSTNQDVGLDCGYYTLNQWTRSNNHRLNISLRYNFNATKSKYKGSGAGQDTIERMGK